MLTKPPVGGMPIRPSEATVNMHSVMGMILPMPRYSSARVLPVSWMNAPAERKSVFLISEWQQMCSIAPTKPSGVRVDRPKRM